MYISIKRCNKTNSLIQLINEYTTTKYKRGINLNYIQIIKESINDLILSALNKISHENNNNDNQQEIKHIININIS